MRKLYVYYCTLAMLLVALFASCSSMQKITVKQEQEGQVQETVIESDTKVNSFNISFYSTLPDSASADCKSELSSALARDFAIVITSDKIEYNGSVYRPTRGRAANQQKRYADASDVKIESDIRQQYFRG